MALGKPDMKILVVDDFPTMRRIVKTLLKQNGFHNTMEADNGIHAFQLIESENDFELVVSDWNMPEMTGLELLKKVRSDARFKHLPFLMVTAEAEKENIIEAVKAGVSNYVVKPFTGQILKEKLEKVFSLEAAKMAKRAAG